MQLAISTIRERKDSLGHGPRLPFAWATEPTSLAVTIQTELEQSHYSGLRALDVSVKDGVVLLRGVVASFHLKQLAQQAVLRVLSKSIIRNDLEVVS